MKDKQKKEIIFKLPDEVMETCQFTEVNALTIKASEGLAIIHKSEMTALEVAYAIDTLSALASELTVFLAKACGICDHCGEQIEDEDCEGNACDEVCAMLHGCKETPSDWVRNCELCQGALEGSGISVPDYLLEEAGIPADAKLEAYVDEDNGEVTIVESDIQQ
ncbi:MAG: hypothetical protein RR865_14355, partial [Clostridia bacterium]